MGYTDKEAYEALSKDCGNLQAENARLRAEVKALNVIVRGTLDARDLEKEKLSVALLQLGEAKTLLAKAEDQGLFHTCDAEGYIAEYGCDECREALEGQILKFLGPTIEKLPAEKRVDATKCSGNHGVGQCPFHGA